MYQKYSFTLIDINVKCVIIKIHFKKTGYFFYNKMELLKLYKYIIIKTYNILL